MKTFFMKHLGVTSSNANYIVTIRKLWKHEGYPKNYTSGLKHSSERANSSDLNPGEIYQNVVSEIGCDINPPGETRNFCLININRVLIGHININSVWNKIEMLSSMIQNNINILMVPGTRLYSSCPDQQFSIECSSRFRYAKNSWGSRISFLYMKL